MSGFRSTTYAVWWRNAHNFFTNPAFIVPGLLFPMFFFTAFAGGLSRIGTAPGFHFAPGYTASVYGFVLMQASAFGGVFTGFAVAADYESGFARRLMLAAPRRTGLIAGYVITGVVRYAFTASVVTVAGLIAGMQVDGGPVDLGGLLVLGVVVNVVATLFGPRTLARRWRSSEGR